MKPKLVAVCFALFLIGGIATAKAETARCQLLSIEASTTGQGIDPALREYASIFKQKPFLPYNTFKLVNSNSYDLKMGSGLVVSLPTPLLGRLSFDKIDKGWLNMTFSLSRPSLPDVVVKGKASPGTPFFTAGFKSPRGRWVFGIICNRNKTPKTYKN